MDPRVNLKDVAYLDAGNGMMADVHLEDFNLYGCRLKLGGAERTLLRQPNLVLHLPTGELSIGLLPFREDAMSVTALFKRTKFALMRDVEIFLRERGYPTLKKDDAA